MDIMHDSSLCAGAGASRLPGLLVIPGTRRPSEAERGCHGDIDPPDGRLPVLVIASGIGWFE